MRFATAALLLLTAAAILPSGACKNRETHPTSVELKLFTSGELSAGVKIAALDVEVALGPSVSLASANSSTLDSNAVTISGVVPSDSLIASKFTAPTDTVGGKVRIGLISATGFGTGEFATIKGAIVGGNTPAIADFNVSGFTASDIYGQEITGLTTSIAVNIY